MNANADAPILIGGVGGSGTRVVTRILAQAGCFIGAGRNHAEDSEPIMDFFDAWLRPYISSGGSLPDEAAQAQEKQFFQAIADHQKGIENPEQRWVVKVPRSHLMLPYWCQKFPKLQFVHVIRNGLDMAYSADTNQLKMFQDLVLVAKEQELPLPVRAIAYWRTVNMRISLFAASSLGSRYCLLRFEDLCRKPVDAIERLAAFVGVPIEMAAAVGQVIPPSSIERWRAHPAAEIRWLVDVGSPALEHFGYWNASLNEWLALLQ
jgi:hypothetical protein